MQLLCLLRQNKMQLLLVIVFSILISAGTKAQEGKCASEHLTVTPYSGNHDGSFLSYGIGDKFGNPTYSISYVINTDDNKLSKVVVTQLHTQQKYNLQKVTQITSPVKYTCNGKTNELKSGYIFSNTTTKMTIYYYNDNYTIIFYIPGGPSQIKAK